MAKLVWRVKMVAELGPDLLSETEVGRIERGDRVIRPASCVDRYSIP